jgi:hypothetical protein
MATIERIAPTRVCDAKDLEFLWFPEEQEGRVYIDLSGVEWMTPLGVVALLARCMAERNATNRQLVVVLPTNAQVRTYLERIGFYKALTEQGIQMSMAEFGLLSEYSVRACLPVTMVTTQRGAERAAERLLEAFDLGQVTYNVKLVAFTALCELTNNAREHGSSCFAVAQTHTGESSGTPGVHLAIADFGPGFRERLKEFGPKDELEALKMAFRYGVSSRKEEVGGAGLPDLLEEIRTQTPGAQLEIVSRNGLYRWENGEWSTSEISDCNGVFARVYFPPDGVRV